MSQKICPMKFQKNNYTLCSENKCAWWVIPDSTEGISCGGMCAIEMIAMKNSKGQYRV